MKFLRDFRVRNKRVLVRADFNIFLDENNAIKDDFRIRATIPTIEYLLKNDAKIILMAHLGKPVGRVVEKLKLDGVQEALMANLDLSITKAPDCIGKQIEKWTHQMRRGEILLLENLRFQAGEEKNDETFAKELAKLGDIYINDAFGVCHRRHASVVAITKFLPNAAGLLLAKEINALNRIIKEPSKPLVVIIGGVKISTKIKLIKKFLDKDDQVILGGALANTVLHTKGIAIGESLIEESLIPAVQKLDLTNNKLHIPVDAVVCTDKRGNTPVRVAPIGKTRKNELILDIGPETEKLYGQVIKGAKTIIWNGPMGMFEVEKFSHGTKAIAEAIADNSSAFSIIGGGETIALISQMGILQKFDHISTGGGAMLSFLAGEEMPGIEALDRIKKLK